MIADAILQSLIHPKTRASVSAVDSDMIRFADGHSLPILQGKPVFRFVFSNTGTASWADWAYMSGASVLILLLGIRTFVRAWPRTVVML